MDTFVSVQPAGNDADSGSYTVKPAAEMTLLPAVIP